MLLFLYENGGIFDFGSSGYFWRCRLIAASFWEFFHHAKIKILISWTCSLEREMLNSEGDIMSGQHNKTFPWRVC